MRKAYWMVVQVQLEQVEAVRAWKSDDGHSRLYHGDSLELMASLPAQTVDCIWTDPPYNLSNDGITCVSGRMVKVNKGEWDRSRGVDMDHEFNLTWLAACYRLLKPTGTIWVTGTLHVYPSVGFAMQQLGFRILNDIIAGVARTTPQPGLPMLYSLERTNILGYKSTEG